MQQLPERPTPAKSPHRYGVLGTGAVGALYGSRLWRAGNPVRFCLRSDLQAGLAQRLQVQSPSWGDVTVPAENLCGSVAALGPLDGLLVALKTTANRDLDAILAPMKTPPRWIKKRGGRQPTGRRTGQPRGRSAVGQGIQGARNSSEL